MKGNNGIIKFQRAAKSAKSNQVDYNIQIVDDLFEEYKKDLFPM
jgi:hypothetical protein